MWTSLPSSVLPIHVLQHLCFLPHGGLSLVVPQLGCLSYRMPGGYLSVHTHYEIEQGLFHSEVDLLIVTELHERVEWFPHSEIVEQKIRK